MKTQNSHPKTLKDLQKMFPITSNGGRNVSHNLRASTGYIPMHWVLQNLETLKSIISENGLRRCYRGPRQSVGNSSNSTRKADAHSMVLYTKYECSWR